MNKKHEKKYTINMLIGFILTTIGIFAIVYIAFTDDPKFDWVFWAIISSVAINGRPSVPGKRPGAQSKGRPDPQAKTKNKNGKYLSAI